MDEIEFVVGDKVRFKQLPNKHYYYTETDNIPDEAKKLIIHGRTTLSKNEGEIVALFKVDGWLSAAIVRYTDTKGNRVQLGMELSNLEHFDGPKKQFTISYELNGKILKKVVISHNREDAISKVKHDSINYVMEE